MTKKTLNEHFQEFYSSAKHSQGLREETLRGYEAAFQRLSGLMPNLTLDKLTVETMDSFFRELGEQKRENASGKITQGVKSSTLLTYRSKLNSFFRWLQAKELISKNPFSSMKAPHVEYIDKKYLDGGQVAKINSAVLMNINWHDNFVKKRNYALLATMLFAGLRKGELLGLRIEDINLDKSQLTVRAETSKSKFNRVLPINFKLQQVLSDYMEARNNRKPTTASFFISSTGDRGLTHDGFKHLISKINRESGVKFHAHQFRHTFAMNVLNQGSDISKLQQLMGHKDIRMTSVYLRQMPSTAMRDDLERLTFDNLL